MTDILGWWNINVPLSPEEAEADKAVLAQIQLPDEVTLKRAEIVIHGRIYEWETVSV